MEETEIIYEIKGYGSKWKVWYPDEGDIKTPMPVYDKSGEMKSVIWVGGESGKLTESTQEFATPRAAMNYAKFLGAEKVKLIKIKPRAKKE